MTDTIADVLRRAITPDSVDEVGPLTAPRSYGVYSLPSSAGATRRIRFGNHPIRQRELEAEFGACELVYLFLDRNDAMMVATMIATSGSVVPSLRKNNSNARESADASRSATVPVETSPSYRQHPSRALNAAFRRRPFQGADPRAARFLFIGLDANYDERLEESSCFEDVLDYQRDGVAFWRHHGVHHPFLLPTYRGDGRRYHQAFARIGFRPQHADQVSFAELLHVPTVGRSKLVPADLNGGHLDRIDEAIRAGQARHIFLSSDVIRLMRASGSFEWLRGDAAQQAGVLDIVHREGPRTVYRHLHFSNYGKFQSRLDAEAKAIARLLDA